MSRISAAARPTSSAGPARRSSASWRRLRELQGVARAELTRIAATIRTELARPTSRPSPRPTRRAEAPPVEGPQTGPKREPPGGAADDTTTPYRFATAGR